MSPETHLCLAAALNGTMLSKDMFDKHLVPIVNGTLEEWFKLCPFESSQWFATDKDAVLAEVAKTDQHELSKLLQEMGFSSRDDMYTLDGSRWSEFIDEQVAMANQSAQENQQLKAKFSLEAVTSVLQEALGDEDPDQIASLWAAYLFGFNRSQVTAAEGTGDAVLLEFASATEREAALEVYRNKTA
jgi:hypothetical protein